MKIAFSQALREVIPLNQLITELSEAGFKMPGKSPIVKCTVFEDYLGAFAMATTPKMQPRT